MTRFHQPAPEGRHDLRAELTLRFGTERLRGRVHWPASAGVAPLILLLVDSRDADAFSTSLASVARAVVLSFVASRGDWVEDAALGWVAEHACDLGADSRLLLVAGAYFGGGHAARLAIAARDRGWPRLHRQLLVHPTFGASWAAPSKVAGICPATIVTSRPADPHLARHVARLRAAGVDVDELRVADGTLPSAAALDELVRSLRLSATDELPTQRSYRT